MAFFPTIRSCGLLFPVVAAAALLAAVSCGGDGAPKTSASGVASATPPASAAPKSTASASSSFLQMAAALEKSSYPAELIDGRSIGNKDAKVVIQVFEDFTCSHCLEFTAESEPGVIEQNIKTGTARLEFHYLPLRQSSVNIMVGAECASAQGKFWDYHKKLFIAQANADAKPDDQYAKAMSDAFSDAALQQLARDISLDGAAFDACYNSPQAAIDAIQKDLEQSTKLGIRGTPGFVVNGQYLANGYPANVSDWKKLILDRAK